MEEIAKEYGMCMLYMLPVTAFTIIFLKLIAAGGILCQAVTVYLNGLAG